MLDLPIDSQSGVLAEFVKHAAQGNAVKTARESRSFRWFDTRVGTLQRENNVGLSPHGKKTHYVPRRGRLKVRSDFGCEDPLPSGVMGPKKRVGNLWASLVCQYLV